MFRKIVKMNIFHRTNYLLFFICFQDYVGVADSLSSSVQFLSMAQYLGRHIVVYTAHNDKTIYRSQHGGNESLTFLYVPSKVPSSVGICDHIVPAKPLGDLYCIVFI